MSNFYNQASWLLVPSGIEEDIVFAQKPTSGLGDLTFTRASDATYTDSIGVVRRSPYNLLQFSEMFSDGVYTKVATTITANTIVAPNGTLTADKLVSTSASSSHSVYQNLGNIGDVRTISCFVKKAEYRYVNLQYGTAVTRFDFDTLTFSGGTGNSYIDAGDGWYRISSILTATVNARASIAIPDNSGNVSYVGDNVSGTFIWGFQAVEGTSALDYFPTTNRQDVPRIDFRNADGTFSSCGRLLLEPQRTNSIRNSSMVGAVAGSPGTLPTNWGVLGLTQTIVGTGTENGLQYIDLRFNGTASAGSTRVRFEATTGIAGTVGQNWSASLWAKNVDTPTPPNITFMRISERNAGGTALAQGDLTITPTTTLQRFAYTRANTDATCAFVNLELAFFHTVGAAYDFTIRIAAPQMELGAYATTWVPTTTAAVTRIKDDAQKTGVSSIIGQSAGTIFWDVNDVTGTTTGTGNPDFGIRNTAFTNWIGITTDTFATPFRIVVRATSGLLISYIANITRAKAAVAWSSAGAVLYVNGVQVGTSAVNPNFSFDRIDMLGGIISYKTNQAALFPTRLTNAQLAQLTTL